MPMMILAYCGPPRAERCTRGRKIDPRGQNRQPPAGHGMHSFAKALSAVGLRAPLCARTDLDRQTLWHATILEAPRRLERMRAWMDWSVDEPCRAFARGDGALHRRRSRGAI